MPPPPAATAHRATYRRKFDRLEVRSDEQKFNEQCWKLSVEVGAACDAWLHGRGIEAESWRDMLAREYGEHQRREQPATCPPSRTTLPAAASRVSTAATVPRGNGRGHADPPPSRSLLG